MTNRRSALVLALGLILAACGSEQPGFVDPLAEAERRLVTQVVDSLGDVGRSASIAVGEDDVARVAYLAFAQPVSGDLPPDARPIGSPAVPAVLSAVVAPNDIDRGSVMQEAEVNEGSSTATAVDEAGVQHVVWTARPAGIEYTSSEDGAEWAEPVRVTNGISRGVSIAAGDAGTVWVAWIEQGAVRVASGTGGSFGSPEDVASVSTLSSLGARTAIGVGSDGQPVIAFNDPGRNAPVVAVRSASGSWSLSVVEPDGGGYGVSIAVDGDGAATVAYYTEPTPDRGEVRVATGSGDSWEVTSVGTYELDRMAEEAAYLSTGVAVDGEGVRSVVWYGGQGTGIAFATEEREAGTFERVATTAGATGVAPTAAVGPEGNVHMAWYDSEQLDLEIAVYGDVELVLAHRGDPTSAPPPPTQQPSAPPGDGNECPEGGLELTAPPGAAVNGFDTAELEAEAGPVQICFLNEEPPTPHNVHVFAGPDPAAGDLGLTEVAPPAPPFQVADLGEVAAGEYFYVCDIHPTTMTGTLTVT